jgi:hypothetical protein
MEKEQGIPWQGEVNGELFRILEDNSIEVLVLDEWCSEQGHATQCDVFKAAWKDAVETVQRWCDVQTAMW